MRIERHDQLGRDHTRPHAQVERVMPDHPPKEQIQPFAAGSGGGTREEITDSGSLRHPAIGRLQIQRESACRKRVERAFDVVGRRVIVLEKKSLHGPCAIDHLPQQPRQRDEIGTARPAMDHIRERRRVTTRIEPADVGPRPRPHDREYTLDRLQDACDPSERKRRRDKRHDLAIVVAFIAPDDLNRVGRRVRIVEGRVQLVENFFQNPISQSQSAFRK